MGTEPDELRREVDDTRAHLARNVDLLADRVMPGRVARRKIDATQSRLSGIKERVMGTAHSSVGGVADTAHSASGHAGEAAGRVTDAVSGTASSIGDAAQQAPAQIRQQTQGSPLAAGVIAFGAGMLAAALLPATKAEEELGGQLREHADQFVEPAKQTALQAAREVREELREPATQAVQAVKETAAESARTTGDHARQAGQETAEGLRSTAQDGIDDIRGSGQHTS
jgi:gas vesicle protein